jgi:hypothetical protein
MSGLFVVYLVTLVCTIAFLIGKGRELILRLFFVLLYYTGMIKSIKSTFAYTHSTL